MGTGSPVAIFENENRWEKNEIFGRFSPGDLILFLKTSCSFERGCTLKIKCFYKIALHQKLLFLQNTPSSTYSIHYI
jgi:hypothetical protein